MERVSNETEVTVQGVGSPVPAYVRGEKAGPGTSLSDDRSATQADHLACVAFIATSEDGDPTQPSMVATDPFKPRRNLARSPPRLVPGGTGEVKVGTTNGVPSTSSGRVEATPDRTSEVHPVSGGTAIRALEDLERADTARIEEMAAILETMRRASLKQRNVSMDIKDGMQKIGELLDAARHGQREKMGAIKRLASLSELPPTATAAALVSGTQPDRKRCRAVVSSPEEEAARAKKKQAVDQGTWSTVNRRRKLDKGQKPSPPTAAHQPKTGNPSVQPTVAQSTPAEPRNAAPKTEQRPTGKKKRKRTRRRPKQRREAVLIKPVDGATYADIVGAIRRQVRPEEAEAEVRQMRRTREGAVLLELGRCGDSTKFQAALRTAVGQTGSVRGLKPRATIEILDLDCVTTQEEIVDAVARATGETRDDLRVSVLAVNPREQRKAVVELGECGAVKLLATARLKIGWVNCRIRRWTQVQRCFRCLGYGHTRSHCTGTDRSNACRKCGGDGHKAADCAAPPRCHLCAAKKDAATDHVAGSGRCKAFREILAAEKSKYSSQRR